MESAQERGRLRQEILDARPTDKKLFYRSMNRQRGNPKYCVNELSANVQVYKTEDKILVGWKEHFESLATPGSSKDFDQKYSDMVCDEIPIIEDICSDSPEIVIKREQVEKAIRSFNRDKAPSVFRGDCEAFSQWR